MKAPTQQEIELLETRLFDAMRNSHVEELDSLLADDLVFTDHLGALWSKQDDLAAHRSGSIKIESLTASHIRIRLFERVAIVNILLEIAGTFAGHPASGVFRFTRVWAPTRDDRWQVVAAHSTLVADRSGRQARQRGRMSGGSAA